jgi:glucose/arabinose dehydrogenase
MKSIIYFVLLIVPVIAFGQQENEVDPTAIRVPGGYAVEAAITGLSVPTTATFREEDIIVAESGFGSVAQPRVLRITPEGRVTVLADEGLQAPVTGLLYVNDILYVSHKGKVSRLENGKLTDVVIGLPSEGDHQNNNLVLGKDGRIYLGQGTVTNSAVVGTDNYVFGWLDKNPAIHDVPCKDVTLIGNNFTSDNPLTENRNDRAVTGAYLPFGSSSVPGQVIKGDAKCNGAILSFNPDGSDLRVVSWGLRNPFGLDVDRDGNVWATYHGADVRGSRGIYNDSDYLVKVQEDAWFGWPEYFNGKPATEASLKAPGSPQPGFLWKERPQLSLPFVTFEPHTGANGLAFSPGRSFWFDQSAFVAAFGTFAPVTTGPNVEFQGFRVLMINMANGTVSTFAENKLPGPAYINRQGGFNRPSDVLFGPDDSMYVVDWGGLTLSKEGLASKAQTGVVWRIYNTETQKPRYANNTVVVPSASLPKDEQVPIVRNSWQSYKQVIIQFWPFVIGAVLLVAIGIVWFTNRRK